MSVPAMVCPKCGFQQDGGEECLRCGVIFDRYRAAVGSPRTVAQTHPGMIPARTPVGLLRGLYRIFSWATLVGLILVIVLILRPSAPPRIAVTPDAVQSAECKVREFQETVQQTRSATLEMDESELNGWLDANLAIQRRPSATAAHPVKIDYAANSPEKKSTVSEIVEAPNIEQVKSTIRDVRIELREGTMRAYVAFDLYGKDLSLELEGRLVVRDGYLSLEPTSGKLGSLPLFSGTLKSAAERVFDSPENKEKFRLPPHIRDMRVERGLLIISSR